MIRIEITETTVGSAGPALAGTVLLDDELELTWETTTPGTSFGWLTQELTFPDATSDRAITFESDPIRWARLLPAMLRNPALLAEIVEDTFEPPMAPLKPAPAHEPTDKATPFDELLRAAAADGRLNPAVAVAHEGGAGA